MFVFLNVIMCGGDHMLVLDFHQQIGNVDTNIPVKGSL